MELSWPQALGRFSAIPELHGRLEEEDLRPSDARKSTHSSLSEGRSILKRYQGFGGMLRSNWEDEVALRSWALSDLVKLVN